MGEKDKTLPAKQDKTDAKKSSDSVSDIVTPKTQTPQEALASAEKKESSAPIKTATPRRHPVRNFLLSLLFILLILSVAGLGWLFMIQQRQMQQLQNQWTQWDNEQQQQWQTYRQNQRQQLETLTQQVSQQQNAMSQLNEAQSLQAHQDQIAWQQAQAIALVQAAHERVKWAYDYVGAKQLLIQAQNLLKQFELVPNVEADLQSAIAQLQEQAQTPQTQVYNQLQQHILNVTKLPFRQLKQSVVSEEKSSEPLLQGGFSEQLTQLGEQLKQLISVHVSHSNETIILSEEQEKSIQLSLEMALNQAQMALLSHNRDAWQASLAQVQQMIEKHFDQSNAEVKQVLSDVQSWQSYGLTPQIGDLSLLVDQLTKAVFSQHTKGSESSSILPSGEDKTQSLDSPSGSHNDDSGQGI